MKIQKVLYAVGNKQLEAYLTDKGLREESKVIGTVVHRGAILLKLHELSQTITGEITLILNEGLPDVSEGTILEICKRIRIDYPQVRILLLAGEHKIGDEFLTALLNMGIYDVIFGEKLNINRVIEVLNNPNTYADALSFVSESNLSLTDVKESKEPEVVTQVVVTPEEVEKPSQRSIFARKGPEEIDAARNLGIPNFEDANSEEDIQSTAVAVQAAREKVSKKKAAGLDTEKTQIPESLPVKTEEKKALQQKKKQSFIFGVSDSYLARELGLSLANILAGKDKVLLCDLTDGSALLPARLDVRVDEGLSYFADNMDDDVDLSTVPIAPYLKNKAVSPFLYILTYGEADKSLTVEEIGRMAEILGKYDYDHIVYVCDRMFDADMVRLMARVCDKTLLVSDQYSVSVNRAYDMIVECKISPGLVVAQTVPGVRPRLSDLKKLYGLKYGEELSISREKLLRADTLASPYIGVGKDKKRIQRLAAFLCD